MLKHLIAFSAITGFTVWNATAGIAYYYNTASAQTGTIGPEPQLEKALHAQFSGVLQPTAGGEKPAFAATGEKARLLWKFVRAENDHTPYSVKIDAHVYAEPGSNLTPALSVGYDEFSGEHATTNYFTTNDNAEITIDTGRNDGFLWQLGNADLLVVPPELKEFYVIITTPTTKNGGIAGRVEKMNVVFEKLPPPPPGELLECSYWAAPRNLVQNVVELGADPSGVKDSSKAFQQALDRGGRIRVPSGRYRIDSQLVIRKSHTSLTGEGLPELFRERNDGDYTFLTNSMVPGIRQMQDIRIENLAFTVPDWQNPHLGNPSAGISINGVKQLEITGCVVKFPAHDGIRVTCGEITRISRCTTYGARHGIAIGGNYRGYNAYDTQVIDNQIYGSWDTGIVVGIRTRRTLLNGNLISRIGCHAIDIFNCMNVTVSGNIIHDWLDPVVNFYESGNFKQTVGIFVHTDWGLLRDIPTENITITGNTLVYDHDFVLLPDQQETASPENAEIYFSPIGIQVTGDLVRNVTVVGNTVTGGAKGFYLSSLEPFNAEAKNEKLDGTPQFVTCVGNTFSGQKYAAIEVDSRKVPIRARIADNLLADTPEKPVRITPGAGVVVEQ